MLSIFLRASWSSVCLLWRHVCLCQPPWPWSIVYIRLCASSPSRDACAPGCMDFNALPENWLVSEILKHDRRRGTLPYKHARQHMRLERVGWRHLSGDDLHCSSKCSSPVPQTSGSWVTAPISSELLRLILLELLLHGGVRI